MRKTIYLFATSERPDAYINAIVHCLLYKDVDRVVFLHVCEMPGTIDKHGVSAGALRNVQIQIERLARGEYRYFDGDREDDVVDLRASYSEQALAELQAFYQRCLDREVEWSNESVKYDALREKLAKFARERAVIDVTSVSKSLLGDIVAASILENVDALYTFDLRLKPNFDEPWRMLIHEADIATERHVRRYLYVNIVDTPVFRACARSILVRGPRLVFQLVAAAVLLVTAIASYVLQGESAPFVQIAAITSGVAGLLSLFMGLWPLRR